MSQLLGHPTREVHGTRLVPKTFLKIDGCAVRRKVRDYPVLFLWDISLSCLNPAVVWWARQTSFSIWQLTGCRETSPSHFQTLLLGRSLALGPWAGVWTVKDVRTGPGTLKGRMGQGVRAAVLQSWALGKLPLRGGPGETVCPKRSLVGGRASCSLDKDTYPAPEAALGLEQGMQEVT